MFFNPIKYYEDTPQVKINSDIDSIYVIPDENKTDKEIQTVDIIEKDCVFCDDNININGILDEVENNNVEDVVENNNNNDNEGDENNEEEEEDEEEDDEEYDEDNYDSDDDELKDSDNTLFIVCIDNTPYYCEEKIINAKNRIDKISKLYSLNDGGYHDTHIKYNKETEINIIRSFDFWFFSINYVIHTFKIFKIKKN